MISEAVKIAVGGDAAQGGEAVNKIEPANDELKEQQDF